MQEAIIFIALLAGLTLALAIIALVGIAVLFFLATTIGGVLVLIDRFHSDANDSQQLE